jgi:hypothetical protein
MLILRTLLGLLIIAGSIALMKYSVQVTEFTGKFEMAEKYLPYPFAGTYSFYKLFGLFLIVLSLLWMFDYLDFLPI